ncbi:MAG: hypothetical protein BYD32DRAFT_424114 [Podila humilis]|nr:MAG: hypothetical protein BYD32DRAFT_424114 [Podila humilis]
MATKHKRKHSRKEQSLKDKERALSADVTFSEPLKEYNSFLDHLKSHGYARNEFTSIPLNLIDLAAAVIASMITGRELSLFNTKGPAAPTTSSTLNPNDNTDYSNDTSDKPKKDDEEADVFYFIQRILKRTQLSCTTLILALIYIDRFKARLAQSLKRRTRLDQGADYSHDNQFSFSFMRQRSRKKPAHDPDLSENDSCLNSTSTSTTTSPSTGSTTSGSSTSGNTNTHTHNHHNHHRHNNNSNKPGLESWSCITLFLISVICADKYLFDATFTNAEWADFTRGQYTTQELNDLERRFLGQLQYKLYVSEPEFDGFLSYLEVILALKQVWGRGFLAALSYSDVRILSQRLMPAYADRLQFRTLQDDMTMVIWQVMATISRVYLTIVGTIMFAAASYAAMMELSALGSRAALEALSCSPGQPSNCLYGSFVPLLTTDGMLPPPMSYMDPRNSLSRSVDDELLSTTTGPMSNAGYGLDRSRSPHPDEGNLSAMEWIMSQASIVQYVEC